ncbi:cytochrome C oxidase subunit IV family protein [Myxococcus stipitatus]|uniref:cytochrome C oxidase subunit IV family protein n=1 Tax=Myxococcus stipitatus TaxID=83455 RepID=UPI0030D28E50
MAGTRGGSHQHGIGHVLVVGVALWFFTTLTWGLSFTSLHQTAWGMVVALAIASVKVGLIAFFFMHLSERQGGPRLVFATAFVFVVILVGMVLLEARARAKPSLPPGPFRPLVLPGQDTGEPRAAPPRERLP